MAELMYGAGLRVHECVTLRVKDVDLSAHTISVRNSKGSKDRTTVLPLQLCSPLQQHLLRVAALHRGDLVRGAGLAPMPDALARKYPSASASWAWQFVFPSSVLRPWGESGPPGPLACVRFDSPAGLQAGGHQGADREARQCSLSETRVCLSSTGGGNGYTDYPVTARSPQPPDDDDLCPCGASHSGDHESVRYTRTLSATWPGGRIRSPSRSPKTSNPR